MFKGLEKGRSLSKNLYLGGNTYALKLKRNIYFNILISGCTVGIRLVEVVAESLCVEGFHFPEAIAQLCLVCPHSHRAHQLKYFY